MPRYFRIIVAEIALTVFLSNIFISSLVWADEVTDTGSSSIVQETLPVEIVPTDTGALVSDTSDLTGATLETNTGFTDTGSLIPGDTAESTPTDTGSVLSDDSLSGAVSPLSPSDTGSIVASGALQEIPQKKIYEEDENIVKKSETKPENEILVQFKTDIDTMVGQYQVDSFTSNHDITVTETITENNIVVVTPEVFPTDTLSSQSIASAFVNAQTDTASLVEDIIAELKQDPGVEHVQKNFIYTLQSTDDPDFSELWGLHNEGQQIDGTSGTPDADIDYPEAMNYASGKIGTGPIVAVLDTGISYNHPEFAGRMWNGQNCLSDTGAYLGGCMHGYDFAYYDKTPLDRQGHGTHVAGTIGAITNNGTGIAGIAPNITLMAVQVLDDYGFGSTSDIIRGINFAKHNGAKVMNASLGRIQSVGKKSDFDFLTYQAIQSFSGIFVAASGNNSLDVNKNIRAFPAAFGADTIVSGEIIIDREIVVSGEEIIPALPNIISVAASDQYDHLASFSNYGTGTVHIAAPGVNIYSTIPLYTSTGMTTSRVTYANGWTRQASSGESSWNTRNINTFSGELTVSGEETIDLSSVLWGDTRYPYVSGESSYIQKTFQNSGKNISHVSFSVWCDTPNYGDRFDRLDILMSTGGLFEKAIDLNEYRLREFGTGFRRDIEINGHNGAYASYTLWRDTIESMNTADSFDIRLKWISEGGSDTHYGCFVNNMNIGYEEYVPSYGYNNGTSMAAPHVAGAAALAMSYAPNASITDIRNAILGSSDWKSQLRDKVMYGRLNIANMLKGLENPAINSIKIMLSGESGAKATIDASIKNGSISKEFFISKNPNFYGTSGVLPEIETLFVSGIISSNSEARIDSMITRAEAAKLVAKTAGYNPAPTCTGMFVDVDGTFGELCGYIEALANSGVIANASNFRPNATITNAEFYKMMLFSVGKSPVTGTGYISSSFGTGEYAGYGQAIMNEGCPVYDMPILMNTMEISHAYQTAVCITKMKDVTDTRVFYTADDAGKVDILGLEPDTTYYYYATANSLIYSTGSRFEYSSFHTPKVISHSGTGNIIASGTTLYLSGSTATGITYTNTGTQKLILTDLENTVILQLALTGMSIIASGSWDGLFHSPELLATNSGIRLSSGATINAESIYQIGSFDTPLALSGKLATINIKTPQPNGIIMRVYRSDSIGDSFVDIGPCIVTAGVCSFTTNHFSQFALGNPSSPIIPPPATVGGGAGPGGPSNGVTNYSVQLSLQNILSKSISPALPTSNNILSSIDSLIVSLQKHAILSYLKSVKYDSQKKASENAQKYLIDPIIIKINTGLTRGQKLLGYDFALHALDTKRHYIQTSTFESTVLNIAFQKISDARLKYIRQAFSE